jgi:hypothetical protein
VLGFYTVLQYGTIKNPRSKFTALLLYYQNTSGQTILPRKVSVETVADITKSTTQPNKHTTLPYTTLGRRFIPRPFRDVHCNSLLYHPQQTVHYASTIFPSPVTTRISNSPRAAGKPYLLWK